MRYLFLFLIAFVVIAGGCKKKKDTHYVISGDYLIIGRAGAFTPADATTKYYLVSGGELREDNTVKMHNVPDSISQFNFSVLRPVAEYEAVKNVVNQIPAELLARNNTRIGDQFPDAGYTDVRTIINGIAYRWLFEANQAGSSEDVQRFVDSVSVVFR